MIPKLLILFDSVLLVLGLYEGDICQKDGLTGTCVNFKNCRPALDDLKTGKNPQICAFDRIDPIVCCLEKFTQTALGGPTNRPGPTTTEEPDLVTPKEKEKPNETACDPIPASFTSPKTGQKAWDKCVEYQEKYVYPCVRNVALIGGMTRVNDCKHNADELVVGGDAAALHEFPHMAMIGYSEKPNLVWICGGSIISENFILTAGHCIAHRDHGNATHVVVRVHTRKDTETADDTKLFRIKRIIKHPDYLPPNKFNDIALMETDKPIKLDKHTVPACLDIGNSNNDDKVSATGWGLTEYYSRTLSDTLQKVTLTKFTAAECTQKLSSYLRLMPGGVNNTTQVCYGDRTESKDTCTGDSGGPLQIKSRSINCMYVIIGVTSAGKRCGFVGDPGIYTRVAPYVNWIESVVWP